MINDLLLISIQDSFLCWKREKNRFSLQLEIHFRKCICQRTAYDLSVLVLFEIWQTESLFLEVHIRYILPLIIFGFTIDLFYAASIPTRLVLENNYID